MAAAGARVLVVAQAWVGDLVLAQVLFALLAQRDAVVDVAAPAWAGPLLARMPQVREHLALEAQRGRPGLAARARLARAVRGRHARAIVLPRSAKAALLPWLAGIPARTGFAGGGRERLGLINDPRPRPANMSARMAALAPAETAFPELLPRPRLTIDPERAAATARRLGIDPVAPFVALAPGAAGGAGKRWPAARFARLAARLAARGYRLCVLGTAADEARGAEIRAAAPARTVDLCGRTTLDEALETLACCRAAVCNDSGCCTWRRRRARRSPASTAPPRRPRRRRWPNTPRCWRRTPSAVPAAAKPAPTATTPACGEPRRRRSRTPRPDWRRPPRSRGPRWWACYPPGRGPTPTKRVAYPGRFHEQGNKRDLYTSLAGLDAANGLG